jgi:hypothetical protein
MSGKRPRPSRDHNLDDSTSGDGNDVESLVEMFVHIDEGVIKNMSKLLQAGSKNYGSTKEWLAALRPEALSEASQRQLQPNAQQAFFKQVIANKFSVAHFNEFRYSRDNTIEREYWIWDVDRADEWVIMHVHFAGAWNKDLNSRHDGTQLVNSVNLRHSVSADQATELTWYRKCQEMDAERERYGTKVEHLPCPEWDWRKTDGDSTAALAVKRIMATAENRCVMHRYLQKSVKRPQSRVHPEASSSVQAGSSSQTSKRLALILAVGKYRNMQDLPRWRNSEKHA